MRRAQTAGGTSRAAASFELRGRTRACAELIAVHGKDVLDVGCSFGWYCRYATTAGAKSVVGVDTNDEALAVAREYARSATFVRASAIDLPFADEEFDVVTMFEVMEHVPKRTELRALREARRVLRPHGQLALSTPSRAWFATYSDPAFYLGHRHYPATDLGDLVRNAGFDIVQLSSAGGVFDQLDVLLYYMSRNIVRRERHPFGFIRRRAESEWLHQVGANTLLLIAART